MKKLFFLSKSFLLPGLLCLFLTASKHSIAQERTEICIPDIPGFITLKCDFHMHTLFSDGSFWPSIRVEEAWREGLDVISITDHIEYHPAQADVKTNLNRPYEIAKEAALKFDIILIKGAEITRDMPPGHLNALFTYDNDSLNVPDPVKSIEAAIKQKAFLHWNHPGDLWYPLHTQLLEKGLFHGIEVVNANRYYPEAHRWVIEKDLTLMSNSDVHGWVDWLYDKEKNQHRPLTMVFARSRSSEAVREALFAGRTAAYFGDTLIGKEEFLKPIFFNSVQIMNENPIIQKNGSVQFSIHNSSDVRMVLEANQMNTDFSFPPELILPAHKTVMMSLENLKNVGSGLIQLNVPYKVKNFWTGPGSVLDIELELQAFSWQNIKMISKRKNTFSIQHGIIDPSVKVFYTTDGSVVNQFSAPSTEPFIQDKPFLLKIAAYKNGQQIGSIYEKKVYIHKGLGHKLTLLSEFHSKYSAGGSNALIDGSLGGKDYNDGFWQGFHENDMMAEINLEKQTVINKVEINFLQNVSSWIFLPLRVEVLISDNGKEYQSVYNEKLGIPKRQPNQVIKKLTVDLAGVKTSYIKVIAKNVGICPEWHTGAGEKAWLFVDEIIIE